MRASNWILRFVQNDNPFCKHALESGHIVDLDEHDAGFAGHAGDLHGVGAGVERDEQGAIVAAFRERKRAGRF